MADSIEYEPRDCLNPELPLLIRDGLRLQQDRRWVTWLLSILDSRLFLGHWWFPLLIYERRHLEDGFVSQRSEVRRTLAGYVIPWGVMIVYYDDGTMASQEGIWGSSFGMCWKRSKGVYWLPGSVKVSLSEWLAYHGQEMPDDVMQSLGED